MIFFGKGEGENGLALSSKLGECMVWRVAFLTCWLFLVLGGKVWREDLSLDSGGSIGGCLEKLDNLLIV